MRMQCAAANSHSRGATLEIGHACNSHLQSDNDLWRLALSLKIADERVEVDRLPLIVNLIIGDAIGKSQAPPDSDGF